MKRSFLTILLLCSFLLNCKDKDSFQINTTVELGQQIGELAASVDESSGDASGNIAMLDIDAIKKSVSR